MRYVMLIYGNENPSPAPSQAEQDAEMAAYNAFTQEVSERDVLATGVVAAAKDLHKRSLTQLLTCIQLKKSRRL